MKTAKDLELSLLLKESHIQQLNLRVNNLSGTIDNLLQRNDDLKQEIERLNILLKGEHEVCQRYLKNISNAIDYIEMCKSLAIVDKTIIFSISTLERTLKGDDKNDISS